MFVPYQVLTLLEQKGCYWLTVGQMGKRQAILLYNLNVTLQASAMLNPATVLPITEAGADPQHNCLEIIDQVNSKRQTCQISH